MHNEIYQRIDHSCDEFDIFDTLFDDLSFSAEPAVISDEQKYGNSLRANQQIKQKKRRIPCKSASAKPIKKILPAAQPMKLLAFPSFDKSDAMVYFPSTFARLQNSGDCDKLREIFQAYCTRDCRVEFMAAPHSFSVPVTIFLQLLVANDTMYPDGVLCMRSTKVVENQIVAELYFKHYDLPEAHQYRGLMSSNLCDQYKWLVNGEQRTALLIRNMRLDTKTEFSRNQAIRMIESQERLEMYGKVNFNITFNPYSKKVTKVDYLSQYTAIASGGVTHDLIPS